MKSSRLGGRHIRLVFWFLLPIALIAITAALAGDGYSAAASALYDEPDAVRAAVVITPSAYLPALFETWPSCGTPPCLRTPINGGKITTLAPLLLWDAGPSSAAGYWTEFSPEPDAWSLYYCFHGIPCEYPGSGMVSVRGTGFFRFGQYEHDANLQPDTTYSWGVVRCNDTGQCRQSDVWTFTTPARVTLPPAPSAITATVGAATPGGRLVTLDWVPVDGALDYDLCLEYSGEPPYSRNCRWLGNIQHTVQLELPSFSWHWHVAALGAEGEGPGVLGSFTVP